MSLVEAQRGMTDLLPCNDACGGDYAHYTFGQTDKEVTVTVPLPTQTPTKQIRVDMTRTSLSIHVPGLGMVLSGTLYKPIKVDDSAWFVQDRATLIVTLAKSNLAYEEWWPRVVDGEREIDMTTLRPPAVHISELDAGAQATVARMMREQHEKRAHGDAGDVIDGSRRVPMTHAS